MSLTSAHTRALSCTHGYVRIPKSCHAQIAMVEDMNESKKAALQTCMETVHLFWVALSMPASCSMMSPSYPAAFKTGNSFASSCQRPVPDLTLLSSTCSRCVPCQTKQTCGADS